MVSRSVEVMKALIRSVNICAQKTRTVAQISYKIDWLGKWWNEGRKKQETEKDDASGNENKEWGDSKKLSQSPAKLTSILTGSIALKTIVLAATVKEC